MILESIVTTVDADGNVNVAPMGPTVKVLPPEDCPTKGRFTLRPFRTSRTYANLRQTGRAVVHVTDDVGLFAKAAVGAIDAQTLPGELLRPIGDSAWWALKDCHRWFAVEVDSIDEQELRVDMHCRVVESEVVRPFFGFNRAKHAVIEAAILATRTHLLSADDIKRELQPLAIWVEKTAGPQEQEAFEFLKRIIDERLGQS